MSDRNFSSEADAGVMAKQVKSLYAQVITGMNNHFAELPNSQVTFRIRSYCRTWRVESDGRHCSIDVGDDFLHIAEELAVWWSMTIGLIARQSAVVLKWIWPCGVVA